MDVFQQVTDRILAQLEKGVAPWKQSWVHGQPVNYVSKRPYTGLNQILLACSPYQSPFWLTLKQVNDLKGRVNKGEKATLVIFWKISHVEETDGSGNKGMVKKFLLRYYYVFNIEQTSLPVPEPEGSVFGNVDQQKFEACEKILAEFPNRPFYQIEAHNNPLYIPSIDLIKMPKSHQFTSLAEYYGTFFHEAIHATGHRSRLNRRELVETDGRGGQLYSREELTAEIGAATLCNLVGIEQVSTFQNSCAYIKGWLSALKNDKRLILEAASKAKAAIAYLLAGVEEEEGAEQE